MQHAEDEHNWNMAQIARSGKQNEEQSLTETIFPENPSQSL